MEKLFKRIPKVNLESEKEHSEGSPDGTVAAQKNSDQSEKQPEITQEKAKKHEGHAPKFSWSIKPQGDQKPKHAKADKEDIPDDLWIKCAHCKELIYNKEFENNKKVCPKCGHHFRLGAYERVSVLLDEGSFEEINPDLVTGDPLKFTNSTETYRVKSDQTRTKTGLKESIITGFGTLESMPLALAVCDFNYLGGSMGSVFGEKLVRLVEEALERRVPLLAVSASGGARMHEGMFSLMQMAKTTAAFARLGEAGLPFFSLLVDPCTGGVIASYASVADIIIAEPGALIGFAGPRVIEQVTKQKLPPDFQTAEFFLEHGMVDQVVARKELRPVLARLLRFYGLAVRQNAAVAASANQREVSYAR
ncbi:MAG: Acetyl-coenzyme carboxylase carboxyl transferase subunit beta [Chloroflexi bacterium]|nr:Acetyl-coenzyme carboxylase carboxyl transferase subunit beta [Chloroflexota bacterium]